MSVGNNQFKGECSLRKERKTWVKPEILQIEQKKIRQEEVELYYRMMDDPKVFRLMDNSGPI